MSLKVLESLRDTRLPCTLRRTVGRSAGPAFVTRGSVTLPRDAIPFGSACVYVKAQDVFNEDPQIFGLIWTTRSQDGAAL